MTAPVNGIEPMPVEGGEADPQPTMQSASANDHRRAMEALAASILEREAYIAELRRTLPK